MIHVFAALLSLFFSPALAQCNGQFAAHTLCGNLSNVTSAPIATAVTGTTSSVLSATKGIAAGCIQIDASGNATSTGANCGNAGATAPGGSDKQIQFNSTGAFAGAAQLTFAGSTLTDTGPFVLNRSGVSMPAAAFGASTLRIGLVAGAGAGGIELYGANGVPTFIVGYSQGDIGTPTATTTGNMYSTRIQGWDSTNGYSDGVQINMAATTNWTSVSHGAQIIMRTTPNGSTTNTTAVTIDQDQSITVAGAGTITGQLNATATTNNIALVTGTGSANRTTLVNDNSRALLHGDNAHNLISSTVFGVLTNGLMGCMSGCSNTNDLNTAVGAFSVSGPGIGLGGTNPTLTIVGVNSNQLNVTPAINFGGAGGTLASPSATSTALMMQIAFEGWNGSSWVFGGNIGASPLETWNGTNNGAQLTFFANKAGTVYSQNSLTMTLDAGNGLVSYYPVVLHGASAVTSNAADVALGNTTAASANCGSLAGATACLKFYIGANAHYIPYY